MSNESFFIMSKNLAFYMSTTTCSDVGDRDTQGLYAAIFETASKREGHPLFHASVSVEDTFRLHLEDDQERRSWQCNACHSFMNRFGSLAYVDPTSGVLTPLFWDPEVVPERYRKSVAAMAQLFVNARVTATFQPDSLPLGKKQTGEWFHMHYQFTKERVERRTEHTNCVEHEMLKRVLDDNSEEVIHQAAKLLGERRLQHAEKHMGAVRWLENLKNLLSGVKNKSHRENLIWLSSATAYLGCIGSLRNGATSVLLEALRLDDTWEEVEKKWNNVVDPYNYMRPKALPTEGNVAHAEKVLESLGITKDDLRRAFLCPDQLPDSAYVWRKQNEEKTGVFGGLATKNSAKVEPLVAPFLEISFAKFVRDVLPNTKQLEIHLDSYLYLFMLITGLPGSKPLMQWHNESNLASWYTYGNPSLATTRGLTPGWADVPSIVLFPNQWQEPLHEDKRYLVVLKGVKDKRGRLSLFPSMMRRDFYAIRSTIEAYSNSGTMEEVSPGQECVGGIGVKSGERTSLKFRATDSHGHKSLYSVTSYE